MGQRVPPASPTPGEGRSRWGFTLGVWERDLFERKGTHKTMASRQENP